MGKRFAEMSAEHVAFVRAQKLFFVGTATESGRVNISPKGMDSLAVLGPSRVIWLNVTGSGNETSAHVQVLPRMTLLFCAFEGKPQILRLYGQAKVYHRADPEWAELIGCLPPLPGARQIFDLRVDLVQTSCGMAVPLFDYVGEREQLSEWARARSDASLREYWSQKNQVSLDGLPTDIVARSG